MIYFSNVKCKLIYDIAHGEKSYCSSTPFLFFLTDFYLACFKDYVSRLSKKVMRNT